MGFNPNETPEEPVQQPNAEPEVNAEPEANAEPEVNAEPEANAESKTNTESNTEENQGRATWDSETQSYVFTNDDTAAAEEEAKKKAKKKKLILFGIIGGAAAVIIAVIVSILIIMGMNNNIENSVLYAMVDEDGVAYISLNNGKTVKIDDDVKSASMTKDRKNILVLTNDKELYIADKDGKKKKEISDECSSVLQITDDGFFYYDEEDNLYRVKFSDYSEFCLMADEYSSRKVASKTTTMLYTTEDGEVMLLKNSEEKATKLGSYSENASITLKAVSDDGKISVWTVEEENETTVYLNEGDKKETVGKFTNDENSYSYLTAVFSKDQKTLVVYGYGVDKIWIKSVGKDIIEVKSDGYGISTNNGDLGTVNASEIKGYYVPVASDDTYKLYYISAKDGERTRVSGISEMENCVISNNKIIYLENNDTFVADLNGAEIKNAKQIENKNEGMIVAPGGEYVYLVTKENDDGTAELACYKIGSDEAVEIPCDIESLAAFSKDGKTIFFFEDEDEADGTGTLMKWSYGDKEAVEIADGIMADSASITSGIYAVGTGYPVVDPSAFTYFEYDRKNDEGDTIVTWKYYNGSKSVDIAEDIIYD